MLTLTTYVALLSLVVASGSLILSSFALLREVEELRDQVRQMSAWTNSLSSAVSTGEGCVIIRRSPR